MSADLSLMFIHLGPSLPAWLPDTLAQARLVHGGPILLVAERAALDETLAGGDIFVIGGAEIYRAALPLADRIELTEVHADVAGDAVFTFDRSQWREMAREDHVSAEGLAYSFVTLQRTQVRV